MSECRAVRSGWLRMVDDRYVMRPGPRLVEGVRRLQAIVQEWVDAQGAKRLIGTPPLAG